MSADPTLLAIVERTTVRHNYVAGDLRSLVALHANSRDTDTTPVADDGCGGEVTVEVTDDTMNFQTRKPTCELRGGDVQCRGSDVEGNVSAQLPGAAVIGKRRRHFTGGHLDPARNPHRQVRADDGSRRDQSDAALITWRPER